MVGRWAIVLGTWMLVAAWPQAFAEESVIIEMDSPAADKAADAPEVVETARPDAPAKASESVPSEVAAEPTNANPQQETVPPQEATPPQEAAPPPVANKEPAVEGEVQQKRYAAEVLGFDSWENALDLKATSMFDRKATNFNSPTVLLTAEWNYRFRSDTYLGLALSGAPQKANIATKDGSTSVYTTYYGGIGVGQSIYSRAEYRAVLQVAAGFGVVYRRTTPAGSTTSSIDKPQYSFVEPGLIVTLFDYKNLDIGVIFTYRYGQLIVKSPVVTNADVTSATFGLTFRNRHH